MKITTATKRAKKIKAIRAKYGRHATHELLVHRSNNHISGYVISLTEKKVLFSISCGFLGNDDAAMTKVEKASKVGEKLASMSTEKSIYPVINRAQYPYHGRVKALIDSFMNANKLTN